jgi:hypothetical protein
MSKLEKLSFAMFVAAIAAVQAPLVVAWVSLAVVALLSVPIALFCSISGWEFPHTGLHALWAGTKWLLFFASLSGAINGVVCVMRGKDNWLLAMTLTQDEQGDGWMK